MKFHTESEMDRLLKDLAVQTDTDAIRKIAQYIHSRYMDIESDYETLQVEYDNMER